MYPMPRRMEAWVRGAFFLAERRFPQSRHSLLFSTTKLFPWRFPCNE
jgi:hypothetical protein